MASLNYKHLYYFWVVAKAGSIARASEQLHLTPQTISGQLSLFEEMQGEALFRKQGRNLELTEAGRLALSYADDIFALGRELEDVLHHRPSTRTVQLRVGVSDALPKTVAYRLLEPALSLPQTLRINCREGKLELLLAELAMHKLDVVLTDSAMSVTAKVRGYSHLLGQSGISFFATPALAAKLSPVFPALLDGAPLLLPGEDAALRGRLLQWLDRHQLHPQITGEFDDSALMSAFGQAGAGIFAAPSVIADMVMRQYDVQLLGQTEDIQEQFYAISVQRKLTHPAVLAISEAARSAGMFGNAQPTQPSAISSMDGPAGSR